MGQFAILNRSEMKWNEMKWNENEMKWNEIYSQLQKTEKTNVKKYEHIHIIIDRHLLALRAKSKTQNSRSKIRRNRKTIKMGPKSRRMGKNGKSRSKIYAMAGSCTKAKAYNVNTHGNRRIVLWWETISIDINMVDMV